MELILLLSAAVANLLWSTQILITNKNYQKPIFKAYGIFAIFLIIWTLTNAYFHSSLLIQLSKDVAISMATLANITSAFGGLSLYAISCLLKSNEKKINTQELSFIGLMVVITLILNLTKDGTIADVMIHADSSFIIEFTSFANLFFTMGTIIAMLTLRNLWQIKKFSDGINQLKSAYMLTGFAILIISTVSFHVISTIIFDDFNYVWLPPLFSLLEIFLFGCALLWTRFPSITLSLHKLSSHIVNISLYFGILWLAQKYAFENRLTHNFLFICAFCFLASLMWKQSLIKIKSIMNYLFFLRKDNILDDIRNVNFKAKQPIMENMKGLAAACRTDYALFSPASDNGFQCLKEYSNSNAARSFLLDEINHDSLHANTPNKNFLFKIEETMKKEKIKLVVPLFDNNELQGLFLFGGKNNKRPFYSQEINELEKTTQNNKIFFDQKNILDSNKTERLSLAANIAHEIRTPLLSAKMKLNTIDHFLPTLIDSYKGNNPKSGQKNGSIKKIRAIHLKSLEESISNIDDDINRVNATINMLLNSANNQLFDTNSFRLHSMKSAINKAIVAYPFKENTANKVTLHLDEDFHFLADDLLFEGVMFNLLNNAFDAIKKAGKGHIEVSLKTTDEHNQVIITDYACGIPKSVLPKVFDDFFTTKANGSGTGIGLPYCKSVMSAFSGNITCCSNEGENTTFILSFPKITSKNIH